MAINIGFRHGVYVNELPTAITAMTTVTAPTLVFGTAPVHLAAKPAPSNVPILCSTLAEFVEQFGWSDNFDDFTLCEAAHAHFTLYNVAPVVFVNVLDPHKHAINAMYDFANVTTTIKIENYAILDTVAISTGEDDTFATLAINDDYTVARDDSGDTIITILNYNKIVDGTISVSCREIDITAVTSETVIGGVDSAGKNTGLEVIEDVYPKLGVLPGNVIAPKFSTDAAVAKIMAAKVVGINGCFKALALADLPTSTVTRYTQVAEAKTSGNLVDQHLLLCWPKVALGGKQYHLSTQLAALMCVIDADRDNIPYKSPSNEFLQCDSCVLSDGTEIYLGRDLANQVNSQGVVTALNFGGFRSWGNHVTAFPADSDPINFIAVRRMLNWMSNTQIINFFSRIDDPMNRVLVDTTLDKARIWLNGLAARGAILGGDAAFLEEDNPTTELTKGHMLFRENVGFCVPAQDVEFEIQFDTTYLSTLFTN